MEDILDEILTKLNGIDAALTKIDRNLNEVERHIQEMKENQSNSIE